MSTSSQAAALAAFKGISSRSKSEINHDKRKQPFVIPNAVEHSSSKKPNSRPLKVVTKIGTNTSNGSTNSAIERHPTTPRNHKSSPSNGTKSANNGTQIRPNVTSDNTRSNSNGYYDNNIIKTPTSTTVSTPRTDPNSVTSTPDFVDTTPNSTARTLNYQRNNSIKSSNNSRMGHSRALSYSSFSNKPITLGPHGIVTLPTASANQNSTNIALAAAASLLGSSNTSSNSNEYGGERAHTPTSFNPPDLHLKSLISRTSPKNGSSFHQNNHSSSPEKTSSSSNSSNNNNKRYSLPSYATPAPPRPQSIVPPQDMIQSIKNSIGSKMIHNDLDVTKRQAVAKVDAIRQSINAKAISLENRNKVYDEATDANNKLHEFREAVEARKLNNTGSIRREYDDSEIPITMYSRPNLSGSSYEHSVLDDAYIDNYNFNLDKQDEEDDHYGYRNSKLDVIDIDDGNSLNLFISTPKIVVDLHDTPEVVDMPTAADMSRDTSNNSYNSIDYFNYNSRNDIRNSTRSELSIDNSTRQSLEEPSETNENAILDNLVEPTELNSLETINNSLKGLSTESLPVEGRQLRRKPPPGMEDWDQLLRISNGPKINLTDSLIRPHLLTSLLVDDVHLTYSRNSNYSRDINDMDENHNNGSKLPLFLLEHMGHRRKSSDISAISKFNAKGKDEGTKMNHFTRDIENEDIGATNDIENDSEPVKPGMVRRQTNKVQLKTTMRTTKKKEMKKQFNENKPWKTHSDASYVNELERKRYEGLFVSNKGLYMENTVNRFNGVNNDKLLEDQTEDELAPATTSKTGAVANAPGSEEQDALQAALLSAKSAKADSTNVHDLKSVEPSQLIHAVVVKRIWKRSRLTDVTLHDIWNLVDFRHDGTLNKSEFLVGMWLIDQCLYGRKLPKVVAPEVWDSVKGLGINVVAKKKGKK